MIGHFVLSKRDKTHTVDSPINEMAMTSFFCDVIHIQSVGRSSNETIGGHFAGFFFFGNLTP